MEIKDFFREEGRLEGFEQGLKQGLEQGLEQGRKETKEIIVKMIGSLFSTKKYSPAQIATLLKLEPNFVVKVCSELPVP
ncbi:MAG TPA: hypothetical protein VL053_20485 [Arachidicoccus sp.]|nr:hypothetical protein [Arachidicoccus sp.]